MKKIIKIAYLYYDLMNLYGEVGNIRALETFIKRQNVDVIIDKLSIGDKIDFKKYDLYYIGCGSEENLITTLDDIKKYKKEIENAISNNKFILATGNSMELFGKKIRAKDSRSIECLGIMDYQSFEEQNRIVGEVSYRYKKLDKGKDVIVGFKNTDARIVHNNQELFDGTNSAYLNNFFTMNFVGPLLIRNPHFTNYLLKNLFEQKGYGYQVFEDTVEFDEYNKFLELFINNKNLD